MLFPVRGPLLDITVEPKGVRDLGNLCDHHPRDYLTGGWDGPRIFPP